MDPLSHKVQKSKRQRRKKPLSEEIKSIHRMLTFALLVLGIGSTVSYLGLNSHRSVLGYQLRDLQIQSTDLANELRENEHLVMMAQSLVQIESNDAIDGMINPEVIAFMDEHGNLAHRLE